MRLLISVLTACLLLSACGGDSERARKKKKSAAATPAEVAEVLGAPAVRTSRLDLAACFAEDIADEATASTRCPSFVLLSLDFLSRECALAGGTLRPVEEPIAWSLDVDGDVSTEILVDLRQNMDCQGVPGVFTCGSLGCPFFLYAKRNDSWVELGAINADDAPAIEVLPGPVGTPATLRGGCNGMQPCSEKTYYEWKGTSYARSWIDFRGYAVDVAPGGLWTLTRDAPILASPEPEGQVLDEYPTGTAVVVIGNARGLPYKFVSPCNACRRGFVDETALRK
jgi:hypothetical protein